MFASSGLPELDALIGGVIPGDNIVWVVDDLAVLPPVVGAFVAGANGQPVTVVDPGEPDGASSLSPASPVSLVERLDASPGHEFADPVRLEQELVERGRRAPGRVVVTGLDVFVRRWGASRALAFFSRVCPQLFDLGAVAYWCVDRNAVDARFVDGVRRVTQCVLEIERGHLRVLKAEGRSDDVQGRVVQVRREGDTLRFEAERALGRLAEGLRRVRRERNLTQAQVAALAGVSASAISQAESGHRGLSLDTLLVVADRLGCDIGDLVARRPPAGYVLARRDRLEAGPGIAALLDDPAAGLRAYLVSLGPGEAGEPPVAHKGGELVVVAQGLVVVDLGDETPVVRSGDAVLATKVPVLGWRNLLAEPARLFWILRD